MTIDYLVAAVLDVLTEVGPSEIIGAAEALRAVRSAVDPAPQSMRFARCLSYLCTAPACPRKWFSPGCADSPKRLARWTRTTSTIATDPQDVPALS